MSEDKTKLFLSVINLHLSKIIDTELTVMGWKPKAFAKLIWLEGKDYMTENNFESPNSIIIKEDKLEDVNSTFSYQFSPHSLTIFEFNSY
jgi:alpha-L-arabinofuranosidase